MGPALMRRFWTVDLEPTTEDWIEWARGPGNISAPIVEFIVQSPAHLRYKGEMEPGKVYAAALAASARFFCQLSGVNSSTV